MALEHVDTVIMGGGQAGLSLSYYLTRQGADHVILERGDIAQGWADRLGEPVPDFQDEVALKGTPRTQIELSDCGAVLFTGGFRPGYDSLLPIAEAFDAHGFPLQTDGKSDMVPGLWFLGAHFLRTRGSSLLLGVGKDAEAVAQQMAFGPS